MATKSNEMTPKERILRSIRGQETDRLCWLLFLAYFWQFQPKSVQDAGETIFLEEIGADPLHKGAALLYRIQRKRCQVKEQTHGNEEHIVYETPVGTLVEKHVHVMEADTGY